MPITTYLEMQNTVEKIRKLTSPIFKIHPPIELAYLFGSTTTNTRGLLSDIDIGIYLMADMPTREILKIELTLIAELTSVLKTNALDLTIMNLASNFLNFEIIRCNSPLYVKNDEFRIEVEHRIHSTYLDRQFHETLFNEIFLRQIRDKNVNI
ncbi:MAG: nucleotidyltransferase [Promethearchaeota archaeon CR_4]|nr:MAG: nucleotidyltransferase [Candidatus Lokiarchaeota archaeon CR_4]